MMRGVKKNLIERPVYRIIDSANDLKKAATALKKEKILAVDLEADSMYHFKEKVCLIQIASMRENLLIDPVAIDDMAPLLPIFSNIKIKKIFHGADYDVRSLYRDFKVEINNLFDTQIASMFLGHREISLNALVKSRFGIELDKKYQKKDWSKRPIPKAMTDYAVRDVLFLIRLSKILEKELKKKKRLEWVREECGLLSNVRPVSTNTAPLFLTFKGAGRLDARSLCVLEAALQLRKKIAKKMDRPLFKVFSNGVAMKLACAKPDTLSALKKCDVLSGKQIAMVGDALVKDIRDALQVKNFNLPVYPKKKTFHLCRGALTRVESLKEWRDKRADELKIDPAVFFNKSTITAIAKKNPGTKRDLEDIKEMKRWQRTHFGNEIIAVLNNFKQ